MYNLPRTDIAAMVRAMDAKNDKRLTELDLECLRAEQPHLTYVFDLVEDLQETVDTMTLKTDEEYSDLKNEAEMVLAKVQDEIQQAQNVLAQLMWDMDEFTDSTPLTEAKKALNRAFTLTETDL